MLTRILYFIALAIYSISLNSQQTVFKKHYSVDSTDNSPYPYSIELSNSYIYTFHYYGGLVGSGFGLRKISKIDGQTIKLNKIETNDSFSVFINGMMLISENRILLVGNNYWIKQSQSKAILLLIDTNLNIIKQVDDSFNGYDNEYYQDIFSDDKDNIYTIHSEYTNHISSDSMTMSIRKIDTQNLTSTLVKKIIGYNPLKLIKTKDSGYLIYTFSPLYDAQYTEDPIIVKLNKNFIKEWATNIGDYGVSETSGYGITRLTEYKNHYYCWRTTDDTSNHLGYIYKLNLKGEIVSKWFNKDSAFFESLYSNNSKIICFGNRLFRSANSIYHIDANYTIKKQNFVSFYELWDTCRFPDDSVIYSIDANRTLDNGFLVFNWCSHRGLGGKLYNAKNFDFIFKTDSCGYTAGDTCKLIPRIDSIRYNMVYLSLDEYNYKVCGRRWYIDGHILTDDKLVYTFSDTGTYTIGIWGFAGATTDSTSITIHISQLDSCHSSSKDTCFIKSKLISQNCEKIKVSIDKSLSQFCTSKWRVNNQSFYSDSLNYTFTSKGTFPVQLIGFKGLKSDTSTMNVIVDCMSNINNSQLYPILIYPNPTSNYIYIQSQYSHLNTQIYNLIGQRIRETTESKIDVSNLDNGIYFIKILDLDNNLLKQEKIQIQR